MRTEGLQQAALINSSTQIIGLTLVVLADVAKKRDWWGEEETCIGSVSGCRRLDKAWNGSNRVW